jgi:hypothetical protein
MRDDRYRFCAWLFHEHLQSHGKSPLLNLLVILFVKGRPSASNIDKSIAKGLSIQRLNGSAADRRRRKLNLRERRRATRHNISNQFQGRYFKPAFLDPGSKVVVFAAMRNVREKKIVHDPTPSDFVCTVLTILGRLRLK